MKWIRLSQTLVLYDHAITFDIEVGVPADLRLGYILNLNLTMTGRKDLDVSTTCSKFTS